MYPSLTLTQKRENYAIKNRRNFLRYNFEKQGLQIKQVEDERDKYYRWGE